MAGPRERLHSIIFDLNLTQSPLQPHAQRVIEPTVSASDKGRKQITRNRTSYSCKTCRKRKVRCDKIHPACGNCVKTQGYCEWSSDSRRSKSPDQSRQAIRNTKRRRTDAVKEDDSTEEPSPSSGTASKETASTNGGIEERLERLTQLVEALSRGDHEAVDAQLRDFGLQDDKISKRAFLQNSNIRNSDPLRSANSPKQGFVGPSNSKPAESTKDTFEFPKAGSRPGELEDPLSKLRLSQLSMQEGGKAQNSGSTWFALISEELDQLNVLLKDQNRYLSASHIGNQACRDHYSRSPSPVSEVSDGQNQKSFHRAGDPSHHTKAQYKADCEACNVAATDKFQLFQAIDTHPSRFEHMSSDLIMNIPSEGASNVLFRCWMSGVHLYVPILHLNAVLDKYTQFWAWYKTGRLSGEPVPQPNYLCFLYTIWYAGSVSISLKGLRKWFSDTSRAALSTRFHDQAVRCLTLTSFPRNASMYSLAALLMLQIIPAKEEEPQTMSLFMSLTLRVAQSMGLHREPSLFNITPSKAETRRRIFWQIFQLDTLVAISSGLPPLMNHDYFDTRPVSDLKDMLYGTEEGDAYEADVASGKRPPNDLDDPTKLECTSHVSIAHLIAKARYDAAYAISRILKMHLGTERITRDHILSIRKIVDKVDRDINATIRRIPTKGIPELGFEPDRNEEGHHLHSDYNARHADAPTIAEIRPLVDIIPMEHLDGHALRYHRTIMTAFHKFGRIVLSLLIDKIYVFFFLPLLKNAKSEIWAGARQCALKSCHSYMRKFIALAKDPAFQPFQWSWPGTHQPMHATMIMLVDLYEKPTSLEAPRSRALIDQVLSISGPDGSIVSGEDAASVQRPLHEGGREAWNLLRKLREKAWQKAGLDPDIHWTEESQIQSGIAQPLSDAQRMAQSMREDVLHDPIHGRNSDTSAGVRDLLSSAVKDMHNANTEPLSNEKLQAILKFKSMNQPQHMTLATHIPNPAVEHFIPSSTSPASNPQNGYHTSTSAPSVITATNGLNPTSTTATPQESGTTNPTTMDSLRPDSQSTTPFGSPAPPPSATCPAPPPADEEEHIDNDFWTRWDSIFGSRAELSFEDALMDDINWDDLGGHDENMT